MQEAAAGGDSLGLVAGAGFEPAHENPQGLGNTSLKEPDDPEYNTRYNNSAQEGTDEADPDGLGEGRS